MIILSHRGYWKDISEKNQSIAFERSFDLNLGTETDLRDHCGKIVISHDMPKGNELLFEDLLKIMNGRNLPLALNIKADGLSSEIKRILAKYNHTNYFTFDMSIPDMVFQIKSEVNVFTGMSDILQKPALFEQSNGIWLDSFNSDWYTENDIDSLIDKGKFVCIVSSDLHKRTTDKQWATIKKCNALNSNKLMLCTDKPEEAESYFNGKN